MRDANLQFSDAATITANGNSSILQVSKSGVKGFWVELVINGTVSGTTPTLDAKIQYSDSPTFASGVEDGPAWPQQTVTGLRRALLCQTKRAYARINYVVSGTTPSFGGVSAHVVSGPQRDDNA